MFVIVVSEDQPRPGLYCNRPCPHQEEQTVWPMELTDQTLTTDKGEEKEGI